MTTRSVSMHRFFVLFGAALLVGSQLPGGALAQQYLGKARQNCVGVVGVKTPRSVVNVQPFQAVTAETGSDQVTVSCEGEQQPVRLRLGQAMQVDAALDRQPAPGELLEGRAVQAVRNPRRAAAIHYRSAGRQGVRPGRIRGNGDERLLGGLPARERPCGAGHQAPQHAVLVAELLHRPGAHRGCPETSGLGSSA